MKKLSALLLALTVITAQTAYAYDIQVDMNAFEFEVSLQSDKTTDRPTVQMLDQEKTKVIYMGEGVSSLGKDDTYMLAFDAFSVPQDLPTGTYIIRVGGQGMPIRETTVSFINNTDKANALNELNGASDKGGVLIENAAELGIDVSDYSSLSQEWKNVVNKAVAACDLSNDGSVEEVATKYGLFIEAYQSGLEMAVIAGSSDSNAVAAMIENSEKLGLDKDTYYQKLTDKKSVANILAQKSFAADITAEKLAREFDGAVLLSVINQLDWGSARNASQYYADKGAVNISFGVYNTLSSTNKANVFKDLKNLKLTDYEKLSDKFDSIVNKYINSSSDSSSGGGGGGGNGGGHASAMVAPVYTPNNIPTPPPSNDNQPALKVSAFTDMDHYGWAQEAVDALLKRGVIAGDGTGRYYPQNFVTREEFAKIMVMAFGLYESGASVEFADVPEDAWFYGYVASAKRNGVVRGISNDEFGTGNAITRQDMAVMLKRVYDMSGRGADNTGKTVFNDYAQISDYAREAVVSLNGAGVLNGDDAGNFLPLEPVTRAQSAQAVYKLVEIIEGE